MISLSILRFSLIWNPGKYFSIPPFLFMIFSIDPNYRDKVTRILLLWVNNHFTGKNEHLTVSKKLTDRRTKFVIELMRIFQRSLCIIQKGDNSYFLHRRRTDGHTGQRSSFIQKRSTVKFYPKKSQQSSFIQKKGQRSSFIQKKGQRSSFYQKKRVNGIEHYLFNIVSVCVIFID